MRRFRYGTVAAAVWVLMAIHSTCGLASEFKVVPSIALQEEYNDNILFDDKDKSQKEDYITTLTPGLMVRNRTHRMNWLIDGRMDLLAYAKNNENNDVDHRHRGSFRYDLTPRISFWTGGAYMRDSRPDRDVRETGEVFGANRRETGEFDFGTQYRFTEVSGISLAYGYAQTEFEDPDDDDYTANTVNARYEHDLMEYFNNTMARANLRYTRFDYDFLDVDHYTATLGAVYRWSEVLKVEMDLGIRYTDSENKSLSHTFDTWGPSGSLLLKYQWERMNGFFGITADVEPYSDKGTALRTRFLFGIGRKFAENFEGILRSEYILNNGDQGEIALEEIDRQTFNVSPILRWQFLPEIGLEARYTYSSVDDDADQLERVQHRVWLRLSFEYPLFE